MKTKFIIVAANASSLVALHLQAAPTNTDLPKPQSFARYEGMMNKSPFAVATAVATPAATPNFAKDLYIANAGQLAGQGIVTLASSTDKNLKEYLTTAGPNQNGYSITNIEWSDRVGATKVTISKDGQTATLTFNQALLSQPVASAPPPQIAPVPAAIPSLQTTPPPHAGQQPGGVPPPTTIKPAPIPTLPTPPPRVRGVIQRTPNSVPTPNPNLQSED